MKLADYVAKFVAEQGIKYVFVVTGGAVAHLIDSIGKNSSIKYICMQHEQAAAMAADAYSRVTENLGAAFVTSGPGATNLITGICCSYYDSIPTLFITGQVATFRLSKGHGVRQLGFQETEVVSVAKPITKYAVLLEDPKMIRYELEKAVHIAMSGRPGPVLIDIPDNLQREEIEPEELKSFAQEKECINADTAKLKKQVDQTIELIKNAKQPVVVFGAGIGLSKSSDLARKFAALLKFPVLVTWAAKDLFPHNYPLLAGTFGLTGTRYGNFAVQNSDLILSIGSRLDTHATGDPKNFGRAAKKIVVDIDDKELGKFKNAGLHVDIQIHASAKDFLKIISDKINGITIQDLSEWKKHIENWKEKYPMCLPAYYAQKENVNAYVFLKELSKHLREDDIIIADTGTSLVQTFNTLEAKKGQKIFSAFNNTPMGYSLPASIGACFAHGMKRVICISGDGGIQLNIQELATIKKQSLPIKIFVFNNHGYAMIRETQNQWLNSVYHASCEERGLPSPDFEAIAMAYGIKSQTIKNNNEINEKIGKALENDESFLSNINLSENPDFLTTKYGWPIEDISPPLDREEFKKNMLVPILDMSKTTH